MSGSKRWLSSAVLLAMLSVLAARAALGAPGRATLPGDADGNGTVDQRDVESVQRAAGSTSLTVVNSANADANQNGQLDDDDALVIQEHLSGHSLIAKASVRFGRSARLQTGDMVYIQAIERFFPFEVESGWARIRSESTGYDSGKKSLTWEQDGRCLYYHWPTATLAPASDYQITVELKKKTGETKARSIEVALHPVIREDMILYSKTDLYLPFWDIGLHFTRNYCYESAYHPYKGPLGHGWTHAFNLTLTEFTDGSVSIFFPDGQGRRYIRRSPGLYDSAPGDYNRLSRDSDGSFQLRLVSGSCWRFRPDLLLDSFRNRIGKTIRCTYDRQKRLASLVDGADQRLRFEYDTEDRIVRVADSTDRYVTFEYSEAGDLFKSVDNLGVATQFEYDDEHRLTQVRFPKGIRTFTYYPDGRLHRIADSDGINATTYEYAMGDSDHGVRTITDALGRSIRELSVGDGFVSEVINPLGQSYRLGYDNKFRLTSITDPLNSTRKVEPDELNNPLAITDPEGHVTRLGYLLGQNAATSLIDANGVRTRFEYKETGEPVKTIYPDGTFEVAYIKDSKDGSRTIERLCRNGQTNKYRFDNRGLLLQKDLYDGSSADYGYDSRGNLVRATNAFGTLHFEYDALSRVVKQTYPGDRTFQYEHDANGRLTRTIDPDQRTLDYEYDSAGRMTRIGATSAGPSVGYEYDAASQRIRRTLDNGISTEYGYDAAGRVLSLTHRDAKGNFLAAQQYEYDTVGRRVKAISKDGTDRFEYDKLSQLLRVAYREKEVEELSFDPAGNRRAHRVGGRELDYRTNVLNQYTKVGGTILTHDLNGNLSGMKSEKTSTTYEHDPDNRLSRVRMSNGESITYQYDALGRLVARSDAKGSVRFLWSRSQIALEEDSRHHTITKYLWGATLDELVEARQGERRLVCLQDAIGTVTHVVDPQEKSTAAIRYQAFGVPLKGDPSRCRFGFAGGIYDQDTGLINFRARWYSSRLGRFIEPDPIGIAGGTHLYMYAWNQPPNAVDRFGLCGHGVRMMPFGRNATENFFGGDLISKNLNDLGNNLSDWLLQRWDGFAQSSQNGEASSFSNGSLRVNLDTGGLEPHLIDVTQFYADFFNDH